MLDKQKECLVVFRGCKSCVPAGTALLLVQGRAWKENLQPGKVLHWGECGAGWRHQFYTSRNSLDIVNPVQV